MDLNIVAIDDYAMGVSGMREKMPCFVACLSGMLLILTVLMGCGRGTPSSSSITPPADPEASAPLSNVDPCAVALAPHAGTEPVDQDISHLQDAVRHAAMDPIAMTHWERLGWAFIAKARRSFDPGFYKLAEQCARCLAVQQPDSAEALLLQGHVLHQMHRFHDAETLARQLVAQRGLWFDYGLLGDVLMEQGKLTDAVDAYQRMMDQKPGPQVYSRAAHLRWLTGDLAGAIAVMQMATGVGGFHDPEAAAWAHVRLALYEWQAGRVSRASNHLEVALALQPEYPPALLTRGRMWLADGNAAAAVEPLTRAAQLNPLPEYQWVLSDALRVAGRAEDAQAVAMHLRQHGAVEDRRTFVLYLATTGQEIEAAVRLAEEELATRADVFTLDALAWALNAAGRHAEAHAVSQRALTVGTQEARLFYHAGVIAAAVGQPAAATRWFAMATALSQMLLPSEHEHLAQASARMQTLHTILAEY